MGKKTLLKIAAKNNAPFVFHLDTSLPSPDHVLDSFILRSLFIDAINYFKITNAPVDIVCEAGMENDTGSKLKKIDEFYTNLLSQFSKTIAIRISISAKRLGGLLIISLRENSSI